MAMMDEKEKRKLADEDLLKVSGGQRMEPYEPQKGFLGGSDGNNTNGMNDPLAPFGVDLNAGSGLG